MLYFISLLLLLQPVQDRYEAKLLPLVKAHQGKVTLALKNLKTGETFLHQAEEPMPTASLIKVAVLAELYQRMKEGKIKLSDPVTLKKEDKVPGAGVLTDCFTDGVSFPIHDAARLMITLSDNTATNLLIDKLGVKEINERMTGWGYQQTRLNAKVYRGSTTSIDPEQTKKFGLGSTTALDMVNFFADLHAGKLVSPEASKEMLALLKLCHDDSMYRRFLPYDKVAAHKTGATNAVRTSAGILNTESGPVAICVLTAENKDQSWNPDNAGQVLIARIAEAVVELNRQTKSREGEAPAEPQIARKVEFPRLTEPLKVHPKNPRYFSWNGKAAALVSSGEHYGAVVNLDFDYIKYLDTLQKEGMRYTRIFTGSYIEPVGAFGIERNTLAPKPGRFLAPWKRSPREGYAGGGNKFDLTEWDTDYLQRIKAFLTAAQDRGIVVEITFFCSTYTQKQWEVSPFRPANTISPMDMLDWKSLHTDKVSSDVSKAQIKLVQHLVTELNSFHNIVWEIQNEPWADNHTFGETINPYILDKTTFPNRIEITSPTSVAWQRRIATQIRATEKSLPHQHLVFQNVANFRLAIHPSDDLAEVDAVHFHYAYPEVVVMNRALKKPICCDETGFAGKNDEVYRQQAWAFTMAGGGLWNHLDYSFSVGHETGDDVQPKSPGGGSKTLRAQLKVLSDFLNSFDLANMQSDRSILDINPGLSGWCLANPGKEYACYFHGRLPGAIKVPAALNGLLQLTWTDTRTGKPLKTETILGKSYIELPPRDKMVDIALSIRRQP
jgi:beta-lactamase class A